MIMIIMLLHWGLSAQMNIGGTQTFKPRQAAWKPAPPHPCGRSCRQLTQTVASLPGWEGSRWALWLAQLVASVACSGTKRGTRQTPSWGGKVGSQGSYRGLEFAKHDIISERGVQNPRDWQRGLWCPSRILIVGECVWRSSTWLKKDSRGRIRELQLSVRIENSHSIQHWLVY